MKVFAPARHLRMSPRKVRLIADLVRGLDVASARRELAVSNKVASEAVLKLLNSAVANAQHNFHLPTDRLRIAMIAVDGGPVLYRHRPRAFGRSAPIRKRTSHITLALEAPDAQSTRA